MNIEDFTCLDGGETQYMIEFGKWTNVNIDGVNIESGKDGLVFFTGNNAIIRDVRLKTGDDGIFLGGVGFPSVQLEVLGDVSDMEFININYVDSAKEYSARGIYCYLASWLDWVVDNTYKTGDFCRNDNNIYQCNNSNGFSAEASDEPIHSTGIVIGEDGISWHHIDTGNVYKTEIHNISIDSSLFYNPAQFLRFSRSDDAYMRNIYPGTEDSAKATGFTVTNSTITTTYAVYPQTGIIDITFENNTFDSLDYFVYLPFTSMTEDSLYIVNDGNNFTNCNNPFIRTDERRIFFEGSNDIYDNSTFVNYALEAGELRAINYTLPFSTLDNITPVLNDTCRSVDGLYYWDGDSWEVIE